ncbi:hypothetical protein [Nocardia terpenica]|uniref:hypothetical protein n=1 Tax=Nocardia terpenica TaxID=455432 RepID=UPI0012FDA072|nr:hypothetical protein [Nocardia terpenica]
MFAVRCVAVAGVSVALVVGGVTAGGSAFAGPVTGHVLHQVELPATLKAAVLKQSRARAHSAVARSATLKNPAFKIDRASGHDYSPTIDYSDDNQIVSPLAAEVSRVVYFHAVDDGASEAQIVAARKAFDTAYQAGADANDLVKSNAASEAEQQARTACGLPADPGLTPIQIPQATTTK